MEQFFIGYHQPSSARHLEFPFISVSRLWTRTIPFAVSSWIMDSGAFTEIAGHGRYRHSVEKYAAEIKRWAQNGTLLAAVAQDFMCEDVVLKRAAIAEGKLPAPEGFDPTDTAAFKKLDQVEWLYPEQCDEQLLAHQQRTIERYDALMACDVGGVYILPVLQGYSPDDYVRHIDMYGDRLAPGAWVGVGSVCKRNGDPRAIEAVLWTIKQRRPDLRLHGFGLKATALSSSLVMELLHTADSMAWSYAARREGRDRNSWKEAKAYADRIKTRPMQYGLKLEDPAI